MDRDEEVTRVIANDVATNLAPSGTASESSELNVFQETKMSYDAKLFEDEANPFKTIGVIYCTSEETAAGREDEKLADCEVIDAAHAVKAALDHHASSGLRVELVNLRTACLADLGRYDWIFNLAESIYGFPYTEYEIAAMMEARGINFTGSGSSTLKACLDKAVTKAELVKFNILTPAYAVYQPADRLDANLRFPLIVKPVHEDGCIGITAESVAHNPAELAARVAHIHRFYAQGALVEEYIEGRDITASILGNGSESTAMPLAECTYPENNGPCFHTFDANWKSETHAFQTTISRCPCELDPAVEAQIKSTALRAYTIMGCRDYARVDFRLAGSTPYVLEVNPNPCINPDDSGYVRSGKANGFTYDELIKHILDCSIHSVDTAGWFYPAVARRAKTTTQGGQANPSPV